MHLLPFKTCINRFHLFTLVMQPETLSVLKYLHLVRHKDF